MHRVKILLCSSLLFSFYQGMVRTMKMSFTERKIYRVVLLKYWSNSLVLWRMAGSSEWTLLYYGRLVCWLPAAQELFIRADRTLTRLRCGEKMGKYGVEGHKKITWTLFLSPARLPLNSPIFSLLSFSPTAEPGPRLNWSLCKILFFLNGSAPIS